MRADNVKSHETAVAAQARELGITEPPEYWVSCDPGTGASSFPAITFWEHERTVGRMLLKTSGGDTWQRLQDIRRTLDSLRKTRSPLLCILEQIPPAFAGKSVNGHSYQFVDKGVVSLHWSCGLIGSAWDCRVIMVSPITWHSLLKREGLMDTYLKTDLNDSTILGYTFLKEIGKAPTISADINRTLWRF